MVLALGESCYSYYKDWIVPKIGQWIVFNPYSHTRFYCKGVPVCFVDDSDVLVIISDPSLVTPVRRIGR
jgi:co-chaperonin GroES (HSP10)